MKYFVLILGIFLIGEDALAHIFEDLPFSKLKNEDFAFFCLNQNKEKIVKQLQFLHNIAYQIKENQPISITATTWFQNNNIKMDYNSIQKEEEALYFELAFLKVNCQKLKKTEYGILLPPLQEIKLSKEFENLKTLLFWDKEHTCYIKSEKQNCLKINKWNRINQTCDGEYGVCAYYCQPLKYDDKNKKCVECRENNECLSNQICNNGKCECQNSIWNEKEKKCMECEKNSDCKNNRVCQKGICGCLDGIWKHEKNMCVECESDVDCGGNLCINNSCRCLKGLWHKGEKKCVECLDNIDCVSNKVCDSDVFICVCPENIPKWDSFYLRCVECLLNQDCKTKKCINNKCEV